ncbi:hypothetical protein F7725_023711 [Dissostichus mawsoni]|uniref:Uncharacterized protein n=1 Tax=Dissostichus mawsoni TaxID=36200 RepID=A0A7J5XXC1_DISMA|nr:hypothetical protein F7725_023711 [Dissostichus mawsoni]
MADISSFKIQNLTHSDSGVYQKECWTEGKFGNGHKEDEDLLCSEAAENLDVQWLKRIIDMKKNNVDQSFWGQ